MTNYLGPYVITKSQEMAQNASFAGNGDLELCLLGTDGHCPRFLNSRSKTARNAALFRRATISSIRPRSVSSRP